MRRHEYGVLLQGNVTIFTEQRDNERFDATPHESPLVLRGTYSMQEHIERIMSSISLLPDRIREEHSDGLALGVDLFRIASVDHRFEFLSYQAQNLLQLRTSSGVRMINICQVQTHLSSRTAGLVLGTSQPRSIATINRQSMTIDAGGGGS